MKTKIKYFFLCGLLIAASTGTLLAQRPVSKEQLRPEYRIYHKSDKISIIYFRISSRELLYNRSESSDFTAAIHLTYKAWVMDNTKALVDSGSMHIKDVNSNNTTKDIIGTISLNLGPGKKYRIRVGMNDSKKNASTETILIADKTNNSVRQNYIWTSSVAKRSPYTQYVQPGEIRLRSEINRKKKIEVRVYKKLFSLSPPPFSDFKLQQFKYDCDSLYYVSLDDSGFVNLMLPETGFIHLVADTSTREGLTLFPSLGYFPKVATVDAMIEPLRYLCSNDEYKAFKAAKDRKVAVDQFWIDRTGNRDKARDLIKYYYNRVEEGNRRFTSYVEGWKSDRGMIYLLFGEPSFIDRSEDSETWIYGDRFNTSSLRFNFVKVENPFSDNDYFLQRLPIYKPEWYKAVESWRTGRVYNFVN